MDNSDLKKKSQESKAALRDFEKAGTDAVGKLGEAFGVNTGKLEQMLSSVQGLGIKLSESGSAGVAAFGKMLAGINGLSAGIAGLGLGAAVATFKLLSSEAENFKNTVAGANTELATQAYIDTYRQVIHDFNKEFGEGFAKTEGTVRKGFRTIFADFRALWGSGAFAAMASEGYVGGTDQALNNYTQVVAEAAAAARTAEEISNEIYQTTRQISDASVEWARQEREIAEYKRIAYDTTVDTATRQEALNKTVELLNKRYEEEAELRKRLADLQAEMNSLAESSVADVDKANQLRIQEEQVTAKLNNALRELSEKQKSITDLAQKEAAARAASALAAQQAAQFKADAASVQGQLEAFAGSTNVTGLEMEIPNLEIPATVKPELDTQASIEITNELQSIVSTSFEGIGASIGELIGDLATGGDAWKNFANSAASAFGDMAITVGKMAIATGTATLGIKAALESLNGYVAIAAGVALVALGSAVKAGLSNVAGGNYSASTNVASSTGSYSSGAINTGFESRDIQIHVSGTLRAEGNQLLAVIENENRRQLVTT